MIYWNLFLKFFYIGLFSFGGGYATLPFLYDIATNERWYTIKQLTDMIAVSSLTPGPVGINVATFCGFVTSGILGSIISTLSIILPSYIIVTIVFKTIDKFKTNTYIKGAIRGLKPAGCALLTSVLISIFMNSKFHLIGTLCILILITISFYKRLTPAKYFAITATLGAILGYFNVIGI